MRWTFSLGDTVAQTRKFEHFLKKVALRKNHQRAWILGTYRQQQLGFCIGKEKRFLNVFVKNAQTMCRLWVF